MANAKPLLVEKMVRKVMCILHLPPFTLPPLKACLGSSGLSYPGAEDIMDSPYR